jgi:hypothetical protein
MINLVKGGFMGRFSLLIVCLLAGLSFIVSCDDDAIGPPKNTDTLPISGFPNMSYIWWKYQVFDSLNDLYDTVLVACEGNKFLSGGRNSIIWVYHYKAYEDSFYVHSGHDTVFFYHDTSGVYPDRIYVFPLALGRFWIFGMSPYDTIRVTAKGAVPTPAGNFGNSFLVSTHWGFIDASGDEDIWIAKQIGIVKERIDHITIAGRTLKKWTLIDYQPPLL